VDGDRPIDCHSRMSFVKHMESQTTDFRCRLELESATGVVMRSNIEGYSFDIVCRVYHCRISLLGSHKHGMLLSLARLLGWGQQDRLPHSLHAWYSA
jgi:hypothetical protein